MGILISKYGAGVKALQSRKEHSHCARTLSRELHHLVHAIATDFAVQLLQEVISHRFPNALWRAVLTILTPLAPRVSLQERKIGQQCLKIGMRSSIRTFLTKLLIQSCQRKVGMPLAIHDYPFKLAHNSLWFPYKMEAFLLCHHPFKTSFFLERSMTYLRRL